MGGQESRLAAGSNKESGSLDIPSLGDYSQWWGAGIPGLGDSAETQKAAGPLPPDTVQQDFEQRLAGEEESGPRPRALTLDGLQAVPASPPAAAVPPADGSEQDAYSDSDEEEFDDEEASEHDGEDDRVAAEMSRLIGRDGYLLPYSTNDYHKFQEAQLHRLHHQDPWQRSGRECVDDRENIFFRAPPGCPGWLPGGRYLGHEDGQEAVEELQKREKVKAIRARQKCRQEAAKTAKLEEERNKRSSKGQIPRKFFGQVAATRTERMLLEEAKASADARGIVIPTKPMQLHDSLNRMREDAAILDKKVKLDHEKELLRSRFIAIREVEVNPENYTQFCGPLSNAGTAR